MNDSQGRDTRDQTRDRTPGAVGYPEPGGGHDDSQTTTIEDGPPTQRVDGEPGASGPGVRVNTPESDLLTDSKTSDLG